MFNLVYFLIDILLGNIDFINTTLLILLGNIDFIDIT